MKILIDNIETWESINGHIIYHGFSLNCIYSYIIEHKGNIYIIEEWDYDDWSEDNPDGGYCYGTEIVRIKDWKWNNDFSTFIDESEISKEIDSIEEDDWYEGSYNDDAIKFYTNILNEYDISKSNT